MEGGQESSSSKNWMTLLAKEASMFQTRNAFCNKKIQVCMFTQTNINTQNKDTRDRQTIEMHIHVKAHFTSSFKHTTMRMQAQFPQNMAMRLQANFS